MAWFEQLLKTYDAMAGADAQGEIRMTPVAHMNANAQIEVIISGAGEFLGAESIDKDDEEKITLIPVTEASAGRSSGEAPHALSDTLSYIAGDFVFFCSDKKAKVSAEKKFPLYMKQLKSWMESDYAHEKVTAIYHYLNQNKLCKDLVDSGILRLNENGLFGEEKISGNTYDKALVRFRVIDGTEKPDAVWKDETLVKAYTDYYLAEQSGQKDICYLSGKALPAATNHPKGIVAADYGAKLISANDNRGFTFRGRFQDANQACVISYEASQKLHSALTWLAKTQGVYVGSQDKRTFICWNPQRKKVPNIMDAFGLEDDEAPTLVSYRRNLMKAFQGYKEQFRESDKVNVIALDAATTGRLSITYYQELNAWDFLQRLLHWGESCNWQYLKFKEGKKPYLAVETPTFRRMIECAYGRESDKTKFLEAEDRIVKEQTQRLVKCMLEGWPIPRDFVQLLTQRASIPLAYHSGMNRERILSTACAVIAKYYRDKEGVEWEMELNNEKKDNSYWFGALLAVLERVERSTYDRDETRETNAIRYQAAFVNHPLKTWQILEEQLIPYFQKLKPDLREYYKKLISEIEGKFDTTNPETLNQRLKETYLLGYYSQRAELNKEKKEKQEEKKHEQLAE